MSKTKLTEKIALATFDYEGFDPELKSKLICLTGEINRAKTGHIKAAMLMGEAISTANDLLAEHGKYGKFGDWVEKECGITARTALNYMWAWNRFKEFDSVSLFDDGAMYALAAPKVPEEAAKEAKKLASKGVRITLDRAKAIVDSFRPKPPPQEACDSEIISESTVKPSGKSTPEPEPPADDSTDFDPAAMAAAAASKVDLDALAGPYRAAVRQLNALSAEFEGLAGDPKLGVHLGDKITRIKGYFREARETISQMEPVCACESCAGAGCNTCFGSGFWTRAVRGSRKS